MAVAGLLAITLVLLQVLDPNVVPPEARPTLDTSTVPVATPPRTSSEVPRPSPPPVVIEGLRWRWDETLLWSPTDVPGALVFALLGTGALAIDTESGAERWRVTVGSVNGIAAAVGGPVLAMVNATGDNRIVALDAETGQTLWVSAFAGPFAYAGLGSEAVYTLNRGAITSIDVSTGEVLWSIAPGPLQRAAVDGDTIVAADDESIHVISPDGASIVTIPLDLVDEGVRDLQVRGGAIYVVARERDGRFGRVMLSRWTADGSLAWTTPVADSVRELVVNDELILLTAESSISARSAATGAVGWVYSATDVVASNLVSVGDDTYVVLAPAYTAGRVEGCPRDSTASLTRIRTSDGTPQNRVELPCVPNIILWTADDVVFVRGSDGVLAIDVPQ